MRADSQIRLGELVVGVISKDIEGNIGPGGVFIGLVKEKESDIRPTFLGQTDFVSFQVGLTLCTL